MGACGTGGGLPSGTAAGELAACWQRCPQPRFVRMFGLWLVLSFLSNHTAMHHEALTKKAAKLFPKLCEFAGFYLAGGTALALQIGHRVSVDFDLFTPAPISSSLLRNVKNVFSDDAVRVSVNNRDELTVSIAGVKCTFLHYPYAIKRKTVAYRGVPLLAVSDIAVTKAYTIGRRGDFKDYLDLYCILKEKRAALGSVMRRAARVYGDDFNDRLFLEQLVYLDDVSETSVVFLKRAVTKAELSRFFEDAVKKQRVRL